jgi:hypothetical protein
MTDPTPKLPLGAMAATGWAAPDISLSERSDHVIVQHGCTHYRFDGVLKPDAAGHFALGGTAYQAAAGPQPGDAAGQAQAVKATGRIDGNRLRLTLTDASGSHAYELTRGIIAKQFGCG